MNVGQKEVKSTIFFLKTTKKCKFYDTPFFCGLIYTVRRNVWLCINNFYHLFFHWETVFPVYLTKHLLK